MPECPTHGAPFGSPAHARREPFCEEAYRQSVRAEAARAPKPTPLPLGIGEVIGATGENAHLGGAFGRDHYGAVRVEAIGFDWIVCRSVVGGDALTYVNAETRPAEWLAEYR